MTITEIVCPYTQVPVLWFPECEVPISHAVSMVAESYEASPTLIQLHSYGPDSVCIKHW